MDMKRGLLRRSRALTMDLVERVSGFKSSLMSLPEYDSDTKSDKEDENEVENVPVFPSVSDRLLHTLNLRGLYFEDNKNLNEPDIEERFARLSLAFKTDKITLSKRLDLQSRQRDIAEKNIENELKALRESLNALNQLCTESDMRDIITKTQQHVDIVQQSTMRMSSRAETYGAIQQEQRMNCAFETMLNYVEHLKLLYDKEHIELEEYRRLLAEHNLLPPDEKSSFDEDSKRSLPPRSLSLSSSSKPEPRTRLISAVCLLNNNQDTSKINVSSNVNTLSLSPKSRRASLPVGPVSQQANVVNQAGIRIQGNLLQDKFEKPTDHRKDSVVKVIRESQMIRTESEESNFSKAESESPESMQDHSEDPAEEDSPLKDSRELSSELPRLEPEPLPNLDCSLPESCDNNDDDCFNTEIIVPVQSKPLFILDFIRKASAHRIWRWDGATLLLHVRYTISAILATAAMFTLVLTFIPNSVAAH